ncbi:MAG: hypothetical protein ACRESZ_09360 [Methylococcales bacterium]
MHKRNLIPAAVAAVLILVVTTAEAKIFASASRNTNFLSSGPFPVFVPLDNAGATSLAFSTMAVNTKVVISFSAECSNSAANAFTWVNIDILVDGVAISPTNQAGDSFCTSNGTAGQDGWVMAAVNATVTVPAGAHTVQVPSQ